MALRKKTKSIQDVSQQELVRRTTEGRKALQEEAAKARSPRLPAAEREQALERMETLAEQVREADAEGRRRFPADEINRKLARQPKPENMLTPEEREARRKHEAFEAEIHALQRESAIKEYERRKAAGLVATEPGWQGFQPEALAVLASRRIHGWMRGFAMPGEAVVDEYGEEVKSAEQIAKRGHQVAPLINVEEVGTLCWALCLIAERGSPCTFNPREQNLWPDGLVNKQGVLKRLRELRLLSFKIDGADSWTIGPGQNTRHEMSLFARMHPALPPDPPKKSRRKRETAGSAN